MATLYDTIAEFFLDDEWPFTPLANNSVLRTSFQGDNGRWVCYAQPLEEREQALFYSIWEEPVPEERRAAAAESIARANSDLPLGNFELDLERGTLRFKTSIAVGGDRLTPALFKHLVYANVTTFDRYLPGLQALLAGSSAKDAIALVEG